MERANRNQIARKITKSLNSWDYKKAVEASDNETKTRDYLIEPFFNLLGYNQIDDYTHEFSLMISTGKVKKVDMAITIRGPKKQPEILIECKKANTKLTNNHFNQLSDYYKIHKESKIGILTNGLIYQFYFRDLSNPEQLHKEPFFTFNLTDFDSNDIDNLVQFHRPTIDIQEIISNAEEVYFLDRFNEALYKTLYKPEKQLLKLIYDNMGLGGRMSDKIRQRIFSLTNSMSIEEVLEKIKISEGKDSKSGISTTGEELKGYEIIKAMISMMPKVDSTHIERIGYKDYKGQFKIIIDNMPTKEICHFSLSKNKKEIVINNQRYMIESVTTKEIQKHKKYLRESVKNLLI